MMGAVAEVEDSWVESALLTAVKEGLRFVAFCEEPTVVASISQCWYEKTSNNLQIGQGMNTLTEDMLELILRSSILDVPMRPITSKTF